MEVFGGFDICSEPLINANNKDKKKSVYNKNFQITDYFILL